MSQLAKDITYGTHFLVSIYDSDNRNVCRFVITYDTNFVSKTRNELQEWCEERYGCKNNPSYYLDVDLIGSVNYTRVTERDKRLEELKKYE